MQDMWDLLPPIDLQSGLVMSVSSLLIVLFLQPLVENVASASRSIRSVSLALVRLLAVDDSVVGGGGPMRDDDGGGGGVVDVPPRPLRHCERCARRGMSLADVEAVMGSLSLLSDCDGGNGDEDNKAAGCGGCAAAAVVEELLESKAATEAELREAFYVFDRNEDGFVDAEELWNALRRLGMLREGGAGVEDCRRMIAAHDGDGDGKISLPEFRAMLENAV